MGMAVARAHTRVTIAKVTEGCYHECTALALACILVVCKYLPDQKKSGIRFHTLGQWEYGTNPIFVHTNWQMIGDVVSITMVTSLSLFTHIRISIGLCIC